MICLPKESEKDAREAHGRYRAMQRMLEVISTASIERLLKTP
jgi:hypothetical protein